MKNTNINSWWQRSDLGYRDGELKFSGRSVISMANQFGSPTFLYSASRVKDNLTRLKKSLDLAGLKDKYTLYYAMKANRFAPLLTYLKQLNLCGIDACSPNEVEHAISCGFTSKDISFTAGSLSNRDFDILARHEGIHMNCDSLHSIQKWGKLKPGSTIGIRINPAIGVSRSCNDKLQYSGCSITKFGIYKEQFPEALSIAKKLGLKVNRLHFHTGCGYLTGQLGQWSRVIDECLWFVEQAGNIERVNVGGGLGVPHNMEDESLDLARWAEILSAHFEPRNIHVEIEPGDYIVKDAGLLLLEKTFVEQKKDITFVGTDGGFNIAPEPAYYDLPFQPVPLSWDNDKCPSVSPVQIVGNINEALDVWYKNALLPDMAEQQYLALINAGAYSSSMSSNHCMRGQFKEILLF